MTQADFEATRDYLMKNVYVMTARQDQQLGYALDSQWYGIGEFTVHVRKGLQTLTLEQVNAAIDTPPDRPATCPIVIITKDAAGAASRRSPPMRSRRSATTAKSPRSSSRRTRSIGALKLTIAAEKVRITPIAEVFASSFQLPASSFQPPASSSRFPLAKAALRARDPLAHGLGRTGGGQPQHAVERFAVPLDPGGITCASRGLRGRARSRRAPRSPALLAFQRKPPERGAFDQSADASRIGARRRTRGTRRRSPPSRRRSPSPPRWSCRACPGSCGSSDR